MDEINQQPYTPEESIAHHEYSIHQESSSIQGLVDEVHQQSCTSQDSIAYHEYIKSLAQLKS